MGWEWMFFTMILKLLNGHQVGFKMSFETLLGRVRGRFWTPNKDPLAYIQPNSPRAEEDTGDTCISIDPLGENGTPIKTEIKKEAGNIFVLPKNQTDLMKADDKKVSVSNLNLSEPEKTEAKSNHLPLDAKLLPIPTKVAESSLNEGMYYITVLKLQIRTNTISITS